MTAPLDSSPEVPPAARTGRALLALGMAGACAFLSMYSTQPVLPLLAAAFGVSKAASALTVSAPPIAVALVAPFVGGVADRLGRRRVIVASLFALALPTLLAGTAPSIDALVAWRFVQGIFVAAVYTVAIAYGSAEWPARSVGRAMAAIMTGNVIGGFMGRAVSGLVAEYVGWRWSFVAVGALVLLGAFATARWLPRERSAPVPRAGSAAGALRRLAAPQVVATFAVGFNVLFMQIATFTYVTFYLAEPPFRLGAGALSWTFVVYLFGAVVTPWAGRMIGRVGPRRVLVIGLACAIPGAALTLVPHVAAVVVGLALVCTAVFASGSAATSHLSFAIDPSLRSLASGVYLSSYYVGGAVGGVLPALAWHLGGWAACVALVVAVQLATVGIALRHWRPLEPPQAGRRGEPAIGA